MSRVQDDPRDVLAFLNSLGFVGITASQLKLFMKDLKLYRKIKQTEEQEWKDRAKEKIRNKQYSSLNEILRNRQVDSQSSEVISCESTTSRDTSSIQIHFQYQSKGKENHYKKVSHSEDASIETSNSCYFETKSRTQESLVQTRKVLEELSKLNMRQTTPKTCVKIQQEDEIERVEEEGERGVESRLNRDDSGADEPRNFRCRTRSAGTESARTQETQRSSSRSKSFIRPWKLQSESQHSLASKKSDPVALYQRYQQQWKQLSFPGEERHAKIRWEIREKMLGTDPVPRPKLQKSASSATLRKKY